MCLCMYFHYALWTHNHIIDLDYVSKSNTVPAETRLSLPVTIYEELEDIPDPHTQRNLVYDRV